MDFPGGDSAWCLPKNEHANFNAFFMESASIEYTAERNCDVAQVGGTLDEKSYGIALKKGSPYTNQISYALNKLQEDGVLHKLKHKWWKQRGGKNCAVRSAENLQNFKNDQKKAVFRQGTWLEVRRT